MKQYTLTNIVHSGRKGVRGEPVTDVKYEYMIGKTVALDISTLKPYKLFTFWFKNHPFYRCWHTSEVVAAAESGDGKELKIETINTIYEFKSMETL